MFGRGGFVVPMSDLIFKLVKTLKLNDALCFVSVVGPGERGERKIKLRCENRGENL